MLANSITLNLQGEKPYEEDFKHYDEIKNIRDINTLPKLPNFISSLIEDNFKSFENIKPIIDDRMFVISQYHNDGLVDKLNQYSDCEKYEYEENDFWYKYIFIDGDSKTCQSKKMTRKLISESTYDRWVEWGTLFGMSRYSFVAITGTWFGKNRLLPHIQTMYFQIFTLLLAYRSSVIKFADEIQNTTDKDDLEVVAETKQLYKRYLNFLNKLYFKEVTAQDQGIEIYNQAMKIMDIEKYMNDLDNEINELHNYANMIEEEKTSKKMNTITELGAIFLPATVISGLLGMNIIPKLETSLFTFISIGFIIIATFISIKVFEVDIKSIWKKTTKVLDCKEKKEKED